MLSNRVAELKSRVKQQVAASMFINISMEVSDRMTLPEFQMVNKMAKEIQGEMNSEQSSAGSNRSLPAGIAGRARIT